MYVLISTYWNVNENKNGYDFIDWIVLISTYWNVNSCIKPRIKPIIGF